MTASDHSAEFARRGIAAWLAKPFDLEDLLQRVALALGAGAAPPGE
jgi:DNA-binding response OmpR family regulator